MMNLIYFSDLIKIYSFLNRLHMILKIFYLKIDDLYFIDDRNLKYFVIEIRKKEIFIFILYIILYYRVIICEYFSGSY